MSIKRDTRHWGDVTGSSHSRRLSCEQVTLSDYRSSRETQISAEPHLLTEREVDWRRGDALSLRHFSTLTAQQLLRRHFYKSLSFTRKKKEEPQQVFTVDWLQRCYCAVTFRWRYIPFSQQMKHLQESV